MYDVHLFNQPGGTAGIQPLVNSAPAGGRLKNTFHYLPLSSPPSLRSDPSSMAATMHPHSLPHQRCAISRSTVTDSSSAPITASPASITSLYGYYAAPTDECRAPIGGSVDRYDVATNDVLNMPHHGHHYGTYPSCHPASPWYNPQPMYDVYPPSAAPATHHLTATATSWTDGSAPSHRSMQSSAEAIYRSFVDASFIRCQQQQHQQFQQPPFTEDDFETSFVSDFMPKTTTRRVVPEVGVQIDVGESDCRKVDRKSLQPLSNACKPTQQVAVPPKLKSDASPEKQHAAATQRRLPSSTGRTLPVPAFSSNRFIANGDGRINNDVYSVSSTECDSEDAGCKPAANGVSAFQTSLPCNSSSKSSPPTARSSPSDDRYSLLCSTKESFTKALARGSKYNITLLRVAIEIRIKFQVPEHYILVTCEGSILYVGARPMQGLQLDKQAKCMGKSLSWSICMECCEDVICSLSWKKVALRER